MVTSIQDVFSVIVAFVKDWFRLVRVIPYIIIITIMVAIFTMENLKLRTLFWKICYKYYSMFNHFEEIQEEKSFIDDKKVNEIIILFLKSRVRCLIGS